MLSHGHNGRSVTFGEREEDRRFTFTLVFSTPTLVSNLVLVPKNYLVF